MISKATLSARTLALALVLATALSGCSSGDHDSPESGPQQTATGSGDASSPATSEPSSAEPSEPSPSPSPSTSTSPATPKPSVGGVSVLISNSEWDAGAGVTVRGYANTVDVDANCTLDLTKADVTRSVSVEALEGPTTMSCGELTIGVAELTPGDWTAVLSYESTTAWGTSDPVVVTVP